MRVTPGFDPLKAQIGPDEYFVLSRVDGAQTLRQVLLSTGLPVEKGIAIVIKLRGIGALLLPGETAPPGGGKPAPGAPRTVTPGPPLRPPMPAPDVPTQRLPSSILNPQVDAPTMRRAAAPPAPAAARPVAPATVRDDPHLPNPTADELAALGEIAEIAAIDRRRILALERLVYARDAYALLGVARGTDAKTIKRTYFKLSKEIHPDRFYGKQLGSFKDRLSIVFEAVSRAYAKLTAPEPSRQSGVHAAVTPGTAEQPQTPHEYAAEVFDRACSLEVGGQPLEAMKLFAAAVRIDGQTRYLRRAASCALAAGQPKSALEYAKKAQVQQPDDPSSARLLATAFRAAGKLADAEEVLVMAMAMKSENDVLASELRNDLAEVRRLLATSE
jgi:tetratricopeptide (TPR) repeat protein